MLAHIDPAGGAPTQDLIPATIVAVAALALLFAAAWAHRGGRFTGLTRATRWTTRIPGLKGLPVWAAAPIALTTVSLVTAVFGFYWDVGTHIDNGRDPGPFANPAHFFIIFGLAGIALAGYVAVVLGMREGDRGGITFKGWHVPVGGVLLTACGVIALAGFPLDDVWHRIFGQDVTLWGPTHIQMVAGASLATLAMWALYLEALKTTPGARNRGVELSMGAAFLVGLATLQAEFDFGVPQFRLLYQPILLALAAAIGLVAVRIRCGRGGALAAALGFIVIRGALAVLVGPILGRTMPHFPLFLVEAVCVELVALAVPRRRPLALGALAGLAIGTVGLAAEWAWSHAWMPLPWQPDILAEALPWAIVAGVAGGVIGALIGRALSGVGSEEAATPLPRWAGALAAVAAVAAIAWPLPMNGGNGIRADVALRDAGSDGVGRQVEATVRLDPPTAADGAAWFTVTAWQGANWTRRQVVIDPLDETAPGVWRTTKPIPVHGDWKAIVRLQKGRTLAAMPIYLPADPGIPAPGIAAGAAFTRSFVPDKAILQREFTGGPGWLQTVAYSLLLAIALGWITLMVWGLGRLLRSVDPAERQPSAVTGPATPLHRRAAAREGAR